MIKKLKKGMSLIVAFSMIFGLAACNGAGETTTQAPTTTEAQLVTETDTQEETTEETTEEKQEDTTETAKAEFHNGDHVVDINFDDGSTGNFNKYSNGGICEISNVDGELDVAITKCGALDYANQVYFDGFELSQGCIYTYSFDIHSDIDRQVEYRLQINGGDYHAYVGDYITSTSEPQTISVDFEMTDASDPAPRLVFNMGKMKDMDGDPGEHNVYIDNIVLEIKDGANASAIEGAPPTPEVTVSQIGYRPDDIKTVTSNYDKIDTFEVVDKNSGETVYTGTFGDLFYDMPADMSVRQGDFSEVKAEGTYFIRVGDDETYEFKIGEGIYDDIYDATQMMLYYQRCGMELTSDIAGDFAHPACHTENATVYGTDEKKDVSGGWHDAGDYGKYTVPGAKTIADLLLAYETSKNEDDDTGIPESGNGIPDMLDEARYELDFLLKMQDEATGGVYHKVTCKNFPETVLPQDETDELVLSPISTTATGDFAAVMAKASVVYKDIDADFAKTALEAAKKAFDYVKDSDDKVGFKNPKDIFTGEYPDEETNDEVFWAAVELLIATGDKEYASYVDDRYAAVKAANDENTLASLGWADVENYGMYDLVINAPDGVKVTDDCKKDLLAVADTIIDRASQDAFFMAFKKEYVWGSNMCVGDNGIVLLMAKEMTNDAKYDDYAKKQLDYLLGYNSLGYCFISGYGTVTPENPHHRISQVLGKAVPGMLAGGPDSSLEDPYAAAVLTNEAPAKRYIDNAQSYSTNEVTIYWNSPLIYLMAAYK